MSNNLDQLKSYDFKFKKSLTSKQKDAFKAIIKTKSSKPILLNGITGSGKTEVYARVIAESVQNNQGVLILTPEIALTPQLSAYLKDIFNDQVETYHSGVTPKRRYEIWEKARSGETKIYVGTRSAVLLPIKNLGLIIVDEEHDQSYKQAEGFKFSGRDLAIKRAQIENIPVFLGSATPSLQTLKLVKEKKFKKFDLLRRVDGKKPPKLIPLDISDSPLLGGIAIQTMSIIEAAINKGEQVLIFLNRRGFAPLYECDNCGWVAKCSSCESNLVFHKSKNRLISKGNLWRRT